MQIAPQELLKQYVQSQHFTSTADIMDAMKEMFRDVIQQVMEVEMEEELGRERCQRAAGENTLGHYGSQSVDTEAEIRIAACNIEIPDFGQPFPSRPRRRQSP